MQFPISVVVCTRDRVDSLRRCIAALFEVRTAHDWELVIVDNGSKDETKSFLDNLSKDRGRIHIRTIREERRGLASARNSGWRAAGGKIVAFTDDDCYVQADFIDRITTAFSEYPELGFIGGRILLYDKTDVRETILEDEEFAHFKPFTFIAAGRISGANMAFRRNILEHIGGFDELLGAGTRFPSEDIDAFANALWSGVPGAYDPRPTVFHHHGRKTSQEVHDLWRGYDRGRGAYYAKYILNSKSRSVYVHAWFESIKIELAAAGEDLLHRCRFPRLTRPRREIVASLHYLFTRFRHAKMR